MKDEGDDEVSRREDLGSSLKTGQDSLQQSGSCSTNPTQEGEKKKHKKKGVHCNFKEEPESFEETHHANASLSTPSLVHHSKIVIEPGDVVLNFGFLKVSHIYSMDFDVTREVTEPEQNELPNDVRVKVVSTATTSTKLCIQLKTQFDGLLDFSFFLKDSSPRPPLKVIVLAKVLGRNKGTPLLKQGVRCLGRADADAEDSDTASDWDGFHY